MNPRRLLGSRGGFTLVELIIVIAIVSILANVAIFIAGKALSKARDRKRIVEIDSLAKALIMYKSERNSFPPNHPGGDGCWWNWSGGNTSNDSSVQFLPELVTQGYFTKIPKENKTVPGWWGGWNTCSYRYMRVDDFKNQACPACTDLDGVGVAALYTVLENPPPGNIGRQPLCLATCWGEGQPGLNDYLVFLREN